MRRFLRLAILSCTGVLLASGALRGAQPLRMQVSPAVSRAPAVLTVKVMVDAASDNRALDVIAESPTFYRSARIQLDGEQGAAVNEIQFRDLPTGFYQVTGVLIGVDGPRAKVSRIAKVEPSVGAGE
jgi:hypothetical protein